MHPGPAEPADFLLTSNFDLIFLQPLNLQECTVPHLKFLIPISMESEAQGCGMILTGFMLDQSTPVLYHTEANGCIFFVTGVF